MSWRLEDAPELQGKTALVTGANRGLGFHTCLELARKGAHVVLCCRSEEKCARAMERIVEEVPTASLQAAVFDLADLSSIKSFALEFATSCEKIDLCVCNAAVVNLSNQQFTESGEEMHMAINHFGHFALVRCLLPLLFKSSAARVVILSSGAYRQGSIDFEDLSGRSKPYNRLAAYGASKLANMLFMLELNRRLEEQGSSVIVVAAHPGLTGTERQQSEGIGGVFSRWIATSVESGCLPQLRAAMDPQVARGDFYGPRFLLCGAPVKETIVDRGLDANAALRLWKVSEEVTGVTYEL